MRTAGQYENFVLHWMDAHRNRAKLGQFRERAAPNPGSPFPDASKCRCWRLDWPHLHKTGWEGPAGPRMYTANCSCRQPQTIPTPAGVRSMSIEKRCKARASEHLHVVAVAGDDQARGERQFVNGISRATQKKG